MTSCRFPMQGLTLLQRSMPITIAHQHLKPQVSIYRVSASGIWLLILMEVFLQMSPSQRKRSAQAADRIWQLKRFDSD